ncbi:uncharacterized protein LOC113388126 [Ctenocephalides felis]|uniref:uncharacterized protein LOC113388126 n=1 Tax=Ctenocephalides felis TaxID=7515 RepID=UPI000E6E1819|nr:uncharacterized protein LOC113388126 [Ctenocephalides felis]
MLNWDEKSLKLALEYIIEHINLNNLSLDKQRYLKDKFNKVLMFEKVNSYLLDYNWNKFQNISKEDAVNILETLLMNKQIELSLDWIALYGITKDQMLYIDEDFISESLEVNQKNMLIISKFLHELNVNQALVVCEKIYIAC